MPAAGELTPAVGAPRGGTYAVLGSAARWLGCLNAIGALAEVGFSLGVLGADVAPPDLSQPLAWFLAGVLACGLALLCWGVAQVGAAGGQSGRRAGVGLWLGAVAYAAGLLAFAGGCWISAGLALEAADDYTGASYTVNAPPVTATHL